MEEQEMKAFLIQYDGESYLAAELNMAAAIVLWQKNQTDIKTWPESVTDLGVSGVSVPTVEPPDNLPF